MASRSHAAWWLTSLGLVPLFIAGATVALAALGAWGSSFGVVVLYAVLFATPALVALAAVYLLVFRLSVRGMPDVKARGRALALSPILVSPWLILTVFAPEEWAGKEIAAPVLLAGAVLYAYAVPLPGATREARRSVLRVTALAVLALAAAVYLGFALASAF